VDAGKTAAKGDEVHLKPPGLRADDFWDTLKQPAIWGNDIHATKGACSTGMCRWPGSFYRLGYLHREDWPADSTLFCHPAKLL